MNGHALSRECGSTRRNSATLSRPPVRQFRRSFLMEPTISSGRAGLIDFSFSVQRPARRQSGCRTRGPTARAPSRAPLPCASGFPAGRNRYKVRSGIPEVSGMFAMRQPLSLRHFNFRKADAGVVPETAPPALGRGACQHFRLAGDRFHRVEVEPANPRGRDLRGVRRQVRQMAPGLAARPHHHDHHVAVVPRRDAHLDARRDIAIAIQQMHPARFDQRFVIHRAIADRIPRVLFARVFEFAALRDVARAGQGRAAHGRLSSTVLPPQWSQCRCVLMTMSKESGSNPWLVRTSRRRGGSGNASAPRALVVPHAAAGFDQNPWQPSSTTKQLNRLRYDSNRRAGCVFDQSVFGTTPNIAPPSHQ